MLPPSPFTMSCATKTQLNTGGARCVFSFLFFLTINWQKSVVFIYIVQVLVTRRKKAFLLYAKQENRLNNDMHQ